MEMFLDHKIVGQWFLALAGHVVLLRVRQKKIFHIYCIQPLHESARLAIV